MMLSLSLITRQPSNRILSGTTNPVLGKNPVPGHLLADNDRYGRNSTGSDMLGVTLATFTLEVTVRHSL